jgi:hypothetical protein
MRRVCPHDPERCGLTPNVQVDEVPPATPKLNVSSEGLSNVVAGTLPENAGWSFYANFCFGV